MNFLHYCFNVFRICIFILSGVILLAVSGCSSLQSSTSAKPVFPEILTTFPDTWTLHGRISVINENENWYARFNWIQEKEDFQISFTGPLGETELQISQVDRDIRLKTPSYERTSNDLEQLISQETGWKFPVNSLRYWSYGRPNPDESANVKYNEQQHVSEISQSGWRIQYPKRMQVEQYLLPKKIIATEQNMKIKIIITRWELGEL